MRHVEEKQGSRRALQPAAAENGFFKVPIKQFALFLGMLFLVSCGGRKTVQITYPEKLEGLTQLVLASQTKNIVTTDTAILEILKLKISSSQVRITSNVTYDFYLDFEKDGYKLSFSAAGDTLVCDAPPLRVKRPVLNSTTVDYPEKSIFINEKEKAVEKLETLTSRYVQDGEALLGDPAIVLKCREMLAVHLIDLCTKLKYSVKTVIITFRKIAT